MRLQTFFTFLVLGVTLAAIYAISATGLVVTYITSGVFNFAHGAVGMFLAFVYWELRVNRGLPTPLALLITLGVVAPIIGVSLDALVMRRLLRGATVATKLVVTLALLLSFQGLALALWDLNLRTVPGLWGDRTFRVAGVNISWDQATTVFAALAVAFGLRVLFRRTRLGVAMRAVVDNPELCAIKGSSPNRITAASWALGSMLAGLAAILIAPGLNLEVNGLSLLVVQAYAAAVVGRLQNLPATFAGALVLGVSQSMFVGYLPQDNEIVRNLKQAVPFIVLFGALLLFAQRRLPERVPTHAEPSPPRWQTTVAIGGLAVVGAWVLSAQLSRPDLTTGSNALVYTCITLSLVLLTGLSGQVSLMQMSFVGVGAVVLGELPTSVPWLFAFAIAAAVTGIAGALVALPVLRLRGIYLALLTLAVAILMDSLFFGNSNVFGGGESLAVPRPVSLDLAGDRQMFVVCALACAVFANVFLAVRRSALGRMLNALRDSPTACQTMGLSLARIKLVAFGLSAALAGAAGALLGALQVRVGQLDFFYFKSLAVLLVATIFGITSVSGAMLGALFFVVLPRVLERFGSSGGGGFSGAQALQPLIIGLLAMYAARHAGGVSGQLRAAVRKRVERVGHLVRRGPAQPPTVEPVGTPVNV
ncbi:MAG: branched-chain amino acid transport system permease protein livM [Acidimicrobiaceae bacterium]